MMNDIPYAGSENLTDNDDLMICEFVDVVHWYMKSTGGYSNKTVDWDDWKLTDWDKSLCKFKYC